MQTQTGRCVIGAARSVRMLELKSSMKGIVCWYFSWPAPLVGSRKPRPFELGLTCFGCGLDHVIGSKQQLDSEEEETLFDGGFVFDPLFCLAEVSGEPLSMTVTCICFPRSLHVSAQMQTMFLWQNFNRSFFFFFKEVYIKILHQFWKKKKLKYCKNISVH